MSSICEAILDTLVKTKDIRESLIDPALRWDKTLVTDDLLKAMVDNTKLIDIDNIISNATARKRSRDR